MTNANLVLFLVLVIIFAVGYFVGRASIPKIYGVSEGFVPESEKVSLTGNEPVPNEYKENFGDKAEGFTSFSECIPDPSKYVLRSTIPPCSQCPDLSKYILKSEVPSLPDLSKYVLKSSVPTCPPCVCAGQKPSRVGACPSCERCPPPPKCPDPVPCAPCPSVKVEACPQPKLNCKAEYKPESPVKPSLASMSAFGF